MRKGGKRRQEIHVEIANVQLPCEVKPWTCGVELVETNFETLITDGMEYACDTIHECMKVCKHI